MKRKYLEKTVSLLLAMSLVAGGGISGMAGSTVFAEDAGDAAVSEHIQAEFFISPDGDDENPGTYEKTFASLEAAKEAVSKINQDMTGDIYVFVMPGTYYTTETVNFDVADSGTNGYNVIYKCLGEPSEAEFLGGIQVEGDWEAVKANTDPKQADSDMQQELAGKIYKTNLKEQLDDTFGEGNWPATSGPLPLDKDGKFTVNTITVNDTRATQARTLNSDKFEGMPATLFDNPLYTAGGSYVDMTVKREDVSKLSIDKLKNAQERGDLSAQIVCNDIGGKRAWDSDTLPIVDVDAQNGKFTFNPNDVSDFAPLYVVGSDSRYYMQGNLAFLDTPGEFYYNPETYDLYYYPKEGEENLSEQEIIVPTTDKVVNLEGERTGIWDDTKITPVQNITFDGLKFAATSTPDFYSSGFPWLGYWDQSKIPWYDFPEHAKQSTNPVYCGADERPQFQVGTVNLKYTDQITIKNCHVKNAGMNGIELYLGVTNTVIDNSLVEYCANGGIMIEGGYPGVDGNSEAVSYTNHNTVKNTVVHDVGQLVHQTFGIEIANATYNKVENCEVYHSPRRGILLLGSDIGSWNNTASGNRNWSPIPYDVKRDEYTHGNEFSNIYLHDVQQDGGDDGGLFTVFVYYNTHNFSRPNKFDQIVINEVGANPNMSDIAPNNINLDMGWCGVEMSNIKTVNAQHYTIENSWLQTDQVKVDNCTFFFKNDQDGVGKFDDSKMDYGNIGVQTWQYPEVYQKAVTNTKATRPDDTYFEENFEKGVDTEKWSYSGNAPEVTKLYMSEGPFNGKQALSMDNTVGGEKTMLYKEFEEALNKVVTVNIFDRQLSPGCNYSGEGKTLPDTGRTTVRVDNGTDENAVALGIDPDVDRSHYVMNLGGKITATPVERVFGWHELKYDYSEAGKVTLSIDGTEVGTASRDGFDYIALGSPNDNGGNYYDQVYVYGGKDSEQGTAVAKENKKAALKKEAAKEAKTFVDWKFEDDSDFPYDKDEAYGTPFKQIVNGNGNCSKIPSGNTMVDYFNTTLSVVDNPVKNDGNPSDKVLARSGEGGCQGYAQQDEKWSNYVWSADYLYKSSTANAKDNSVSIVLNSQNENDKLGSGYPYQPAGYWFTINEGTKSLELKKASAQIGNKEELDKVVLDDEEFTEEFKATDKWHNIQFYVKSGNDYTDVYVSVDDGKYILSAHDESGAFTEGTFAFNSMGTDYYMDNIQVEALADSPLTGYDENFKLGNAVLDQKFSPGVTTYTAKITDAKEDVTFVKPNGVGATYTITLNGEDITENFADTETAVVLSLKAGNNTLTVTEVTEQQITTEYQIAIYKACTLVSTDIPEVMETNVGETPQLPQTTEATVNDGKQDMQMTSAVEWDMTDQSYYKTPGTFVVKGELTEVKNAVVNVMVKVEGIQSVEKFATVNGKAGTDPAALLAKTVGVQYAHAGKQQKAVKFKTFEKNVYAQAGTIVAVGTAEGYDKDVLQVVELAGEEPEQPNVNKTLLQKTYDYALILKLDGVTDSAKAAFEKAMAEAKAVLDKEDATQEEVNTAWDNLLEGIFGLGIIQGDKSMLEILVAKAESMIPNKDKYVQDNWQQLVDALEKAQDVMSSGDATPDVVEDAVNELWTAIVAQRYKANKDNLKALIDKANVLDLSKYTKESVNTLKAALKAADAVMADDSLSIDEQAKVAKAEKDLKAAIDGLKLASDDGNSNTPDNGGNGNNSGTPSDGNKDTGKDAPKTGDTMNIALWMLMAGAAGAAGVGTKRRKENR